MYTGNLFSYLRSMGVKVPVSVVNENAVPAGFAYAGASGNFCDLIVVKALSTGFTGNFFPSADEYTVFVETDKVVNALRAIMDYCGSKLAVILVSEERQDLVTELKVRLKDKTDIAVLTVEEPPGASLDNVLHKYLSQKYPVMDSLTKSHTAAGNTPPVFSGLELRRAYDALTEEKPVTRALVYCGGEVGSPGFYDIPVGTRYCDIVEACSPLLPQGGYAVLTNYVSKGSLQYDIETDTLAPVRKDTEKLIVLPLNHPLLERAKTNLKTMLKRISSVCNQCRLCTDMCPVYLNGGSLYAHLIVRDVADGSAEESPWIAGADLCISCGVCTAVCPAGISPMQINEFIKGVIEVSGGLNWEKSYKKEAIGVMDAGVMEGGVSAVSGYRQYRKLPVKKLAEHFELTGYVNMDKALDRSIELEPSEYLREYLSEDTPGHIPLNVIGDIPVAELSLSQAGAGARPVVKAGDTVESGSLIASGKDGTFLHASISGTVSAVDDKRIVIVPAGE